MLHRNGGRGCPVLMKVQTAACAVALLRQSWLAHQWLPLSEPRSLYPVRLQCARGNQVPHHLLLLQLLLLHQLLHLD